MNVICTVDNSDESEAESEEGINLASFNKNACVFNFSSEVDATCLSTPEPLVSNRVSVEVHKL